MLGSVPRYSQIKMNKEKNVKIFNRTIVNDKRPVPPADRSLEKESK